MASGGESWSFSSHIVTLRSARLRLALTYQQGQSRSRESTQVPGDVTGPLAPRTGGIRPIHLLHCEIMSLPIFEVDWLPAAKGIPTRGKQMVNIITWLSQVLILDCHAGNWVRVMPVARPHTLSILVLS